MSVARYLLGVAEIGLLAGMAVAGATCLRRRFLPRVAGAPAHLATAVLALAVLVWAAVLSGSAGLFEPLPYLLVVFALSLAFYGVGRAPRGGDGSATSPAAGSNRTVDGGDRTVDGSDGMVDGGDGRGRGAKVATVVALLIAAAALVHFAAGVRVRLGTGMTGFDSTWYHGPFAAGFFQTGDTWRLHFIAPQFLAWFYPANGEIFHAVGMLAFGRDILSPFINLGWFAGCLGAAWAIGRPYRVAPVSLALAAAALSIPALADQAGEARNDLAATFFLLAAVGIALNSARPRASDAGIPGGDAGIPGGDAGTRGGDAGARGDYRPTGVLTPPALTLAGLAAGLAAGTKLNFLVPAAVLVVGLSVASPRGARLRALATAGIAAVAGGGYWYLRNLAHTGNPLPWVGSLGPISLPAPEQALGGREGHSVLAYVGNGSVWSEWFLPGLHQGLGVIWPLLLVASVLGLVLALGRKADPVLRVAALAGAAAIVAWAVAPTSASGPDGVPHGFVSGLRYLAPALVLGLAMLPAAPVHRAPIAAACARSVRRGRGRDSRPATALAVGLAALATVAVGYPVQRHYLDNRYAKPTFAAPGLNAAFRWARSISGARIATTSTRQYPLFGTDLSNRVQFVGIETAHGGFVAPPSCGTWRHALNAGNYGYVVTSRDRIEKGKPPYPPAARWTEGPGATVVLRVPPTVVFKLAGPLPPSGCP